jgi:hypothetical protein
MPEVGLAYSVDKALVACYAGRLYIRAEVTVSATNYEADLERSLVLIFPPANVFLATQHSLDTIGLEVLTPRTVMSSFPQPGECPEKIRISAKTNAIEAEVFRVGELAPSSLTAFSSFTLSDSGLPVPAGGGGEIPSPLKALPIHEDTATGYSIESFDDAFNNAVAKLPPTHLSIPDAWVTVDVTGSGAQYGGFAGMRRYFVSVSRVTFR